MIVISCNKNSLNLGKKEFLLIFSMVVNLIRQATGFATWWKYSEQQDYTSIIFESKKSVHAEQNPHLVSIVR